MPSSSPQHGAIYVKTLVADLTAQGYSERQIFGGTGFDPSVLAADKPIADFDRIAALFEHAAELTGNDMLGFMRGQKREMRRAGLICYVGLSSPTVLDFIKNTARYRRVFSDAIEVDPGTIERDGVLKWHFNVPASIKRRQYVEFSASGLLHDVRQSANRRFCPELVTFRHARNSNTTEFERYFGCQVQFGARENMFRFRSVDLDLPLVTADNELYAILKNCCEETLRSKSRDVAVLIVEVERTIVDGLATGEATHEGVARALGMSPRTLSRKLAVEGTTFFKTLEELRKSLAVSYLRDSDLVLAEIAFLLGYAGLSSFNDAFKRWTGRTPGQFRTS